MKENTPKYDMLNIAQLQIETKEEKKGMRMIGVVHCFQANFARGHLAINSSTTVGSFKVEISPRL